MFHYLVYYSPAGRFQPAVNYPEDNHARAVDLEHNPQQSPGTLFPAIIAFLWLLLLLQLHLLQPIITETCTDSFTSMVVQRSVDIAYCNLPPQSRSQ